MNDIKKTNPTDWVRQIVGKAWSETFESAHFDSFAKYNEEKLLGLSLLHYACCVLQEASVACDALGKTIFKPLVFLPLGFSKRMKKWNEENWHKLGKVREPPSLYIMKDEFLRSAYVEEYKFPVKVPLAFPLDTLLVGIFNCFRTPEDIKNNWEFSSGIYLYRDGDF